MPDMEIYDVHCHLQDPRICQHLEQTLQLAAEQGVKRFGCNGTCEEDWPKVAELANKHSSITPNFGLHPWFLQGRSNHWLEELKKQLQAMPQAGLGECGLDTSKKVEIPLEEQVSVFTAQLELGKELKRPISVHCVSAFGKLQELLQQYSPFPDGLILHSWIGPADMVKSLAKLEGVFFSLSGHLTRMSKKKYEPMIKQIPLARLLLETDAPDGRPRLDEPYQERLQSVANETEHNQHMSNHPVNIRVMLDFLADVRGQDAETICKAAYSNAQILFDRT